MASVTSSVRSSAVLPLPVVPASKRCATSGLSSRTRSGTPPSSTPSTAQLGGTLLSRPHNSNKPTVRGVSRGTSTCSTPPSR